MHQTLLYPTDANEIYQVMLYKEPILSSVHTTNPCTGVALPFRDLHQPTRNIMYFVSVIRKMRSLQHTLWNQCTKRN